MPWSSSAVSLGALLALVAMGQLPGQPRVAPGPNEPDWSLILETRYGLKLFDDLANPVVNGSSEHVRGLFRKAGPGPVVYRPLIALGLETPTRGGWYPSGAPEKPDRKNLWSYQFKNTAKDLETGANLPPPMLEGSTFEFDPQDASFGLWIGNDQFDDGGAFTQPQVVQKVNARLAAQPYKAMIYPNRDRASGQVIPNSYLIGWEYSTNDDFQDVVCQVDNVVLLGGEDGK